MVDLIAEAPPILEACPACGGGLAGGAVICTQCGYNKATGRTMSVQTLKAKAPRARSGPLISLSPMMMLLICLGVSALPGLLAFVSAEAMLVGKLLALPVGLAVFITTLVFGFRTSIGTGILLVVTLFIPLVNLIYWLYFIFGVNGSEHLKSAWGGNILGSISAGCIVASGLELRP